MRIRQIALAARELEPSLAALEDVLGIETAFRDPGVALFGLANGVLPVGDTFLEVVSPATEHTAAGRFLERRGGDGGYMVILQTDDLASARKRAEAVGARVVWETALEDIATVHLHPRDVGAAILSLDEARPAPSWRWAGPDWQSGVRTERVRGIAGVVLESPEPARLAARWSEVLGLPLAEDREGREGPEDPWIALEDGRIVFRPTPPGGIEGVAAIELAATDAEAVRKAARAAGHDADDDGVVLVGTRFRLV